MKDAPPDLLANVGTIHLDVPREPPRVEVVRDPRSVPGTREWFEASRRWVRNTLKQAEADCVPIAHKTPAMREYVARELGTTWEEFCRAELDAKPEWVAAIEQGVAVLEGRGHVGPVTQEQARAALLEASPEPKPPGAPKGSSNNPSGKPRDLTVEASTVRSERPRDNDYWLARLKTEAPDHATAWVRGEYASVNAACLAAGIKKPVDPVAHVVNALGRMTDEQVMAVGCRLDARVFDLLRAGAEE